MLTLHQADRIVHNILLVFKGCEIKRRKEGTNIYYDVHYSHESTRAFLGTYRVWEWHDGSGRSGWMPLDTNDAEVKRMRHAIWEAMIATPVPSSLSAGLDAPQFGAVKPEMMSNPHELYSESHPLTYNIDALEKTLAGLPLKAARAIDFSKFKKLPDEPFGHIRYNIYSSKDAHMGFIYMEKHGENATTVIVQYEMRFEDTFRKIQAVWDKYIKYDTRISKIAKEKREAPQSLPPINAEGLEKVRELSQQGLTVKVIAQRASISESTVKRYRKILGLQRRK